MKAHNIVLMILIIALIGGCGSDQPGKKTETTAGKTSQSEAAAVSEEEPDERNPGDEAAITAMLTELIDRIKEGDKTVLYEMEFSYYTDSVSLSEYMEIPRVLEYKYDTLSGIVIDSIVLMDDSATVMATILYESLGGGQSEHKYPLKVYKIDGRWVRPYLSGYAREMEYRRLVEEYLRAVEEEASE